MRYIVDIDGTICINMVNDDGSVNYELSVPMHDRIETINRLYDEGNEIHYWTARGSASGIDRYDLTLAQLHQWGAKFHSFKVGKPVYDIWIDDKAVNAGEFFASQSTSERDL
jgi:hypothetical protein